MPQLNALRFLKQIVLAALSEANAISVVKVAYVIRINVRTAHRASLQVRATWSVFVMPLTRCRLVLSLRSPISLEYLDKSRYPDQVEQRAQIESALLDRLFAGVMFGFA
jgi:hypothetical protein